MYNSYKYNHTYVHVKHYGGPKVVIHPHFSYISHLLSSVSHLLSFLFQVSRSLSFVFPVFPSLFAVICVPNSCGLHFLFSFCCHFGSMLLVFFAMFVIMHLSPPFLVCHSVCLVCRLFVLPLTCHVHESRRADTLLLELSNNSTCVFGPSTFIHTYSCMQ